ncbi:MAG TPA: class I SAM-dependent methyltransferase [Methylomirabilota bacterium]|nr:class I SAM-dependent methyltransferase [Methylomirabilota bacterium]
MPFRPTFDCLWCGRPHETRAATDLEGWAQLCPDCLGRAGDNEFLRFRLHRALEDRAAAGGPTVAGPPAPAADVPAITDEEDWLLRRGRFAHGPIHDAAWATELDAAGRWLDGLPLGERILMLAPGSGWWAPLLATRGELTVLDATGGTLDRTRERLVAHRLRAHLHEADPWSPAPGHGDPPADTVVVASRLGGLAADALGARLAAVRTRLRPGGLLAVIEPLPEPRSRGTDGSPAPAAPVAPDALEAALHAAGLAAVEVTSTGRFFVLGRATA